MHRPVRYRLHGLTVISDTPIPGLSPVETLRSADLRVWLGTPFPSDDAAGPPTADRSPSDVWFETPYRAMGGEPALEATRLAGGSHYRVTYSDGMDFVINRAASDVWVTWPPTRSVADVSAYLLGPIIGVVMRMRGTVCLHASAIDAGGIAVGFVGHAGAGKSTTAAACAVRGLPVLSDDMLALTESGSSWTVAPGYPRVRLWPESAHAIADEAGPAALVPPGPSGSATRYHLDLTSKGVRFQDESLPLGIVYLLDEASPGAPPAVEPLGPAAGLMALVGNSYAWRVLDRGMRAHEFDALGRLAGRVPVRRLTRPTDLARLPDFVELVLNDLATLGLDRSAAHAR